MSPVRAFTIATATAGAVVIASGAVGSEPMPQCMVRLDVTLSLEVEHVERPDFLSYLVGNHADFRIFLRQKLDWNHIIVDLVGPGPAYRCYEVVDAMKKEANVDSIRVVQSSSTL